MTVMRFAVALTLAACVAAPALAQTAPEAAPVAAVAAPAAAPSMTVVASGDTIETLKANGQFKTLLKALDRTNLTALIKAQKTVTVFAPTDAAFAALPAGEMDRLMKDPAALQGLLVYHLINTPIESAKLVGAKGPVNTVAGSGLVLDGSGEGLKANTANILVADVKTSSGVLFVVDAVLTPEGAAAAMAEPALDVPAGTTPTAP
ncbi:MAG: fasciclin domain-containing protein [Caulobacter sp.]|nr:fasciclin domain-containing protein [Caulobacter sp.]